MDNLFDAFAPADKADWQNFVANDPRAAALLEKLDWQLGPVSMPAYATDEDLPIPSTKEVHWVLPQSWCIAAYTPANAPDTFYDEALAGGANGFWLDAPTAEHPPTDQLFLYGGAFAGAQGLSYLSTLPGKPAMIALSTNPSSDTEFLKANIAQLVSLSPCRTLALPVETAPSNPVAGLVSAMRDIHACIQTFKAAGFTREDALNTIALVFQPSTSFYLEIAVMRAMRLLISKLVADTLTGDINVPFLAYINNSNDPDQLLKQTTVTMAAVFGGCSAICIQPGDTYAAHLAINTQLILKHESHLGRVTDPAAGSYYVELLSSKLAGAVWDAGNFDNTYSGQDHA